MDPYRLPRHVVPTRYDLRLQPDLANGTFAGDVTITVTVHQPATEVLLNAAELRITRAAAEGPVGSGSPGTSMLDEPDEHCRLTFAPPLAKIALEEATERCRLTLAQPLATGTWRLRLSFQGTLNDKLRGFYRSKYKDAAGTFRFLAATQFEATDARRAFPCWDEPAFKAVFATTLVIDPSLTAVSNTAIVSEQVEGGKKVVRFADTIPMSTYLVAFVIGELEATEPVYVGRTPVRVWGVPGKRRLASFGHQIGTFSLKFYEEYYGVPYPGDKLDLLAIPDFAAGAMENLGAITFRETALLVDEQAATHAERERVADVVAHENAHMWFGDLVTMAWWNGLWLNEAFATFLEMVAVDAWKPEWDRWTTFGVSRAAALTVDGLHSTRPIEFPVAAPKDADAMFDVLTYEKGASVLRMIEQYLGPDVFRAGVRGYLRKHAYANTETGDLWIALGEASRQDIPAIMDGWVFRPGYPLVSARLDAGNTLVLSQQRFTYLPNPANADGQRWQVPVQMRVTAGGKVSTQRVLLGDTEARVSLPAGFESVLVNEGGHGFYRVRHAAELLDRILNGGLDRLAAIERFNLVNDAWAATLAGLMPLADYLHLTARFRTERDKNVWAVLIGSLHALNRIIAPADRPALEALVRDRLGPAYAGLGSPQPDESELIRQLRGDLLRALGTLGNDPSLQSCAAAYYGEHVRLPVSADANLFAAAISILAHVEGAACYEEFSARFRTATTPQEEQRYLYALAGFQPAALLHQTLERTLNGAIRTQDAPFVVRSLLTSVYGRELAWDFVKANWDRMARDYPETGLRRMCEGVTGLATPELERDVRRFFAERKIHLGGKTLEQYLEQLRILVALREREAGNLHAYLAAGLVG